MHTQPRKMWAKSSKRARLKYLRLHLEIPKWWRDKERVGTWWSLINKTKCTLLGNRSNTSRKCFVPSLLHKLSMEPSAQRQSLPNKGQRAGSVEKALADKPEDGSSVPRTHKNKLLSDLYTHTESQSQPPKHINKCNFQRFVTSIHDTI